MQLLNDEDIEEIIAGFDKDQLAKINKARSLLNISLKEYIVKNLSKYGFVYTTKTEDKPVHTTH